MQQTTRVALEPIDEVVKIWAKQIPAAGRIEAGDVAIDKADNIYLGGIVESRLDADGVCFQAPVANSGYISKSGVTGDVEWVKTSFVSRASPRVESGAS